MMKSTDIGKNSVQLCFEKGQNFCRKTNGFCKWRRLACANKIIRVSIYIGVRKLNLIFGKVSWYIY